MWMKKWSSSFYQSSASLWRRSIIMTGHRWMFHISQSTVSDWAWLSCLTKRNPQKINKEEVTIWRGLGVRLFTSLLKELLTGMNTCKDSPLFSVTFRSQSLPCQVTNDQLLFISVAALVCGLLPYFCLHEWVFSQVRRMNSLFSSPFDPEPTGQTDRSARMINTAQLQVWVICICINRGKKKPQQQLNYTQRHSAY